MVGKYVLSLVTAALVGGVLTGILPENSGGKLIRLICGVFLLTAVLRPVAALELPDLSAWMSDFEADAQTAVREGEDYLAGEKRRVIRQRLETYILDKAKGMGLTLSVEVSLTEDDLPQSVRLTGDYTREQRDSLTYILKTELGIPEARQQWQ